MTNWWTAGSDYSSQTIFKWCYNGANQPIALTSLLAFNTGEPNNAGAGEDCIEMFAKPQTAADTIRFNDGSCDTKIIPYICEVYCKRSFFEN